VTEDGGHFQSHPRSHSLSFRAVKILIENDAGARGQHEDLADSTCINCVYQWLHAKANDRTMLDSAQEYNEDQ
jgi:hypothetical protein